MRMGNRTYQPLIFRKVFLFGRRWLCFFRLRRRRRRGGFIFLPFKEVLVQQHRQGGHHPWILQLPAQPPHDCVTRSAALVLTTNLRLPREADHSLVEALTCRAGTGFSSAAPAVLGSWGPTRAHGSEDRSPASGKGRASRRGSLSISLLEKSKHTSVHDVHFSPAVE